MIIIILCNKFDNLLHQFDEIGADFDNNSFKKSTDELLQNKED
jgi:hypothetical protein